MKRIKLTLSYDGTDYNGWQYQTKPNGVRTIQGIVEESLKRLTGEEIKVVASGRTDAGVHALGQVIHFDTNATIPAERFPKALEAMLPRDIIPLEAQMVDASFHARYSAKSKEYRYTIDRGKQPHVFWRRFSYHQPYPLDIEAMKQAAKFFPGKHDFSSFCASGSSAKDFTRMLETCQVSLDKQLLYIDVVGEGFLYNMVRIIAGTLVEVGKGKIKPRQITSIIAAKNRDAAGPTLPPQGLCLIRVNYN